MVASEPQTHLGTISYPGATRHKSTLIRTTDFCPSCGPVLLWANFLPSLMRALAPVLLTRSYLPDSRGSWRQVNYISLSLVEQRLSITTVSPCWPPSALWLPELSSCFSWSLSGISCGNCSPHRARGPGYHAPPWCHFCIPSCTGASLMDVLNECREDVLVEPTPQLLYILHSS